MLSHTLFSQLKCPGAQSDHLTGLWSCSALADQECKCKSHLYEAVALGVKQLEDLLEVLNLVLREALVLSRHVVPGIMWW